MPAPYSVSVAGVTFEGRQEVLRELYEDQTREILAGTLEREPGNQYDPNAIKVLVSGVHVGYVPKYLAAKLAPRIDAGESASVTMVEILRGDTIICKITIDILSEEAVS